MMTPDMKILSSLILVSLCLVFCGCKKHSPQPGTTQTSSPPKPIVPAAPEPATQEAGIAVPPSAEQIGSTVRVRVVAGGLPVKDYTGALLHRDAWKSELPISDKFRCVMTVLRGRTEAELRVEGAKFLVYRNLPNATGEPQLRAHTGKLGWFDPQSGVALITYFQGFSQQADLGYSIATGATPPRATALRFLLTPSDQLPEPSYRNSQGTGIAPMQLMRGSFTADPRKESMLEFPPHEIINIPDEVPLVTSAPAVLHGFVLQRENEPEAFVPAPQVSEPMKLGLRATPVKAGFTLQKTNGPVEMTVHVEADSGSELPPHYFLRLAKLPSGAKIDLESMKAFEPIETADQERSFPPSEDLR
jgi:hypothetical protein